MGTITFRRAIRADFSRLARWLAEPHVARWWNHEFTAEAVERDFGPNVDEAEPTEDYIVALDNRPIGLIQQYRFADYPEYAVELAHIVPVPGGAVGIDYLIGAPDLIGKGVGTAMLVQFMERIWSSSPEASCVIVPVCSANVASWRALLSAGFHVVARGELKPDNPIDDPMHEILRLDRPPESPAARRRPTDRQPGQ